MNPTLAAYYKRITDTFAKFSQRKKIIIGLSSVLIVVITAVIIAALRQDPYQILYSDLQNEDSKAIAKKLSERNLPYRVSEDNTTISVPSSRVHEARMELAKEGLPGHDIVGFEKFDGSTIGMSSYIQKIQYTRAIQGELVRSIQRLAAVKTARVHISVPPKKTFIEEAEPAKASVILDLKVGQSLSKNEVKGVAHLVASAVEGLKVNQITIVDTKGNFLHHPDDDNTPVLSTALLEMQRAIENEYEKRIEEMLTPVVGIGKVRAKVTAEIDPSRVNTTEETFDPDKVIPRNTIKTDEVATGQRPNPVGIPGSRSNLPGTENLNPGVPMATTNSEKNSSNTTNAIPRKISVIDKPSGSIKRLTVAVVVDGYYKKDTTSGVNTFSPRPEEELKRLQDLVGNTVGFDGQRRDSVTISSLPFQTTDLLAPEEVSGGPFKWDDLTKHGIRNALIGSLILLFFLLIVRPFSKWTVYSETKKKEKAVIPQVLPKTVAELEKVVQQQEKVEGGPKELPPSPEEPITEVLAAAPSETPQVPVDNSNPEKSEEEDLRTKILERLEQFPKKGIRIVQDWLEEQSPNPNEG